MEKIDNLFIIDDDDIYQFLTKKVIEETNLVNQIKIFSNGSEALDFLRSIQGQPGKIPDIILLDLTMPIMDGWDFLEQYIMLKPKLGKTVVIYIVSSSIAPSDIERARSISEVSDYIIKPITKDKIVDMIKNLI